MKKDIRNVDKELEQFFSDNNLQNFRLKQLMNGYSDGSFDKMSSLSTLMRIIKILDFKTTIIDQEFLLDELLSTV